MIKLKHKTKLNIPPIQVYDDTCFKEYWQKRKKEAKKCKYEYNNKKHLERKEIKIQLLKELGGKCERCGYKDFRALCFHHKIKSKIKVFRNSSYRFLQYREEKNKLMVLCMNCHTILHQEI